jgi:hypothetical protein
MDGYLGETLAVSKLGRSGSRADSPGMSDLARTFDEGDIDAVAAYLNAVHQSLAPIDSTSDYVTTDRTKAVQELG